MKFLKAIFSAVVGILKVVVNFVVGPFTALTVNRKEQTTSSTIFNIVSAVARCIYITALFTVLPAWLTMLAVIWLTMELVLFVVVSIIAIVALLLVGGAALMAFFSAENNDDSSDDVPSEMNNAFNDLKESFTTAANEAAASF